jgi:hypothetical protein
MTGTDILQPGLRASDANARFDNFPVPPNDTAAEDVARPGGQRALGGGVSSAAWRDEAQARR